MLRYYQQEAIDCVKDVFNGILVLPTGTGKSHVITGIAEKFENSNILILQPSKEILEQNYGKLAETFSIESVDLFSQKLYTSNDIGIYSASCGSKEIKRITLATIGSIKNYELFEHFDTIIVDECHYINAYGGQYADFINFIKPKRLIGLTATPYRLHSKYGTVWKFLHRTRPKIFEDLAYVYQNKQAFDDGFLVKPTYYEFDYDTSLLQMKGSDYEEESIYQYNVSIGLHDKIVTIANQCQRKHILVFTTSILEAQIISHKLNQAGITSKEVSSKTSKKERVKTLQDFRNGEVKVVVNVGILTTGFDFPELDCIIGARPTMSLGLFYQMIGRGVRPSKAKKDWDYFDLCSNIKTFGKIEEYVIEGQGSKSSIRNSKQYLIKGSDYKSKKAETEGGDFILPFGKFKGEKIRNVNSDYLQYCINNFDHFAYKKIFELEIARRIEDC